MRRREEGEVSGVLRMRLRALLKGRKQKAKKIHMLLLHKVEVLLSVSVPLSSVQDKNEA